LASWSSFLIGKVIEWPLTGFEPPTLEALPLPAPLDDDVAEPVDLLDNAGDGVARTLEEVCCGCEEGGVGGFGACCKSNKTFFLSLVCIDAETK
jgi:hypothetical protein